MTLVWRIYYGDDSIYDNLSGPAELAPGRDVQVICQLDERVGRLMWHSMNFYWYDDVTETWIGGDAFGLWDYLVQPGYRKVLFGRTLARYNFDAILARANNDPDFPPKSGYRNIEKRRA